MRRTFFGGVHPPERKEMSVAERECTAVVPRRVVIALLQHIGQSCQPLVGVGDYVRCGEKIGDGQGLCVPVHASVSGYVRAVEQRPHPNGRQILSIEIENDFQDAQLRQNVRALCDMNTEDILHVVRQAGIVGMGGAAFPGDAKALAAMGRVDTLLANACECEPYITADDCLLRFWPESVLRGMEIMGRVLQPKRLILAVEDNKTTAIARLRAHMASFKGIELMVLPSRYPQGSEKQLIQAATGRQVPGGKLPADAGCAVFNVSTFAAVDRALREGRALTQRVVTVSGEAVRQPQNFIARIGTPFADLIEAAGGLRGDVGCVLSGGPMMGVAQRDLCVPVVKATNAIVCLPRQNKHARQSSACIRCGKCLTVCPMRLQPLYLYRSEAMGDLSALRRLHLLDCMECGSCAFICPAKLPLVECIRRGKQKLKEDEQN